MNIVSTKKEVTGFDHIEKILQDMANKSGVAHQVVIYSAEDIDYCKTVKPEKIDRSRVKILIEKSSSGFLWGRSEEVSGITGGGKNEIELVKNIFNSVDIQKAFKNIPDIDYHLTLEYEK